MRKWLGSGLVVFACILSLLLMSSPVLARNAVNKHKSESAAQKAEHGARAEKTAGAHEAVGGNEESHEEAGGGHEEAGGLFSIEPGFLLHLTIPVIFPKDPACDHSGMRAFQKFHHTAECGVPNIVVVTWLIMGIWIMLARKSTKKLETIPGRFQCFFEYIVDGVNGFVDDTIGHHGRHFRPLIGTLAIYILSANYFGLVPGMASPSANLSNNAAVALVVFFFTHYAGFRFQGKHYLKHFTGPMMALAPLMVPLHIIGELARPMSLSLRLFGNIAGEEIVIFVLYVLSAYALPVPMMAFAMFGGLIQTVVFVLLSSIYIAGAVSHSEE